MKLFLSLLCWLLLYGPPGGRDAYGQVRSGEAGLQTPPSRFFLPGQYDAHSQNFTFTQDHRGMLYVGNFEGVLEYDGLNWRTIPTQNVTKVTALLTAANGTVYVGANGEFGYLRPDSTGALGFVSLSQRVRSRFNDVLAVLEGPDGIYFAARHGLFRWNGKALTEWTVDAEVQGAFQIDRNIYIAQQRYGLRSFQNGTFQPIRQAGGGLRLTNVVAMLPLAARKALIVSSTLGLFQLSDRLITPFSSSGNDYLSDNQATCGTVLSDQTIAIGTLHGGIAILTPDGKLKQLVREIGGLLDQPINALFNDREGNLWLALNNGIGQLEIPSPLTLFAESARQTGEVMDIRQVGNVIYLATINGLFRIGPDGVRSVAGLTAGSFAMTTVGESLFIATSHGLYQLVGGQLRRLTTDYSLCVIAWKNDATRLYVGTEKGLGMLTVSPGRPVTYQLLPNLHEQVSGVVDDGSGNLWIETLTAGLYKLTPATNQLTHYTTSQGLPTLLYDRVAYTTQGLLVYNEKGVFRYEAAQDRFLPYNPFRTALPAAAYWKNDLLEDEQGNLWTVEGNKRRITLYQKQEKGYQPVTVPFLPLSALPINVIYPDRQGRVWFGGRDGVVLYNPLIHKGYAKPYQTLIRQIQTTGGKTLFNGYNLSGHQGTVTLPHAVNDISFEFSAASFPVNNALTFSYKLENYDHEWSDSTSSKNKKEYTNLPPGDYQFRVRAYNIYNVAGQEAVYAFGVLAPWYQRWWVIGLFVGMVALLIYWVGRWRLNRLVSEKQALETMIRERTEEVVFQKEELVKQSEELGVKNDQLEKIDLIVQSINAEIDFGSLFQTILTKFSVIRNMDNASFLVYEKQTNSFRFKALRNSRDLSYVESIQLTQEQVENRLLAQAVEVYEDIYHKDNVYYEPLNNPVDELTTPKSLITLVIKNAGRIEGFITLENSVRANAFDARDLTLIRNLKEHLIAAFIKTRLLEDLENTLNDLKNTQDELIRQEKLASVGQLTKGIVDRILNPLNYVTNFSQLSTGLIDDQIALLEQQRDAPSTDTLDDVISDANVLKNNLNKILAHSNSTTRILKDMQKLLKEKSRNFLETDLNSFIESKTRTAMQEIKPNYKDFSIELVLDLENKPIRTKLLPYEFGQVVQNMVSNSYYALYEKSRQGKVFQPEVRIVTETVNGQVRLRFRDNGKGIPPREVEQLFNPFFTTKPTSAGTGLGLFMVKDIIETHRGKVEIISKEGEYTEILMTLPTLTQ
ncbi:sensor histidine kinase [Spirosoma koreense]